MPLWFPSVIRSWFAARKRSPHVRPRLESLETREVPAFVSTGAFAAGGGPFFAAVADFNADGNLDAVTADFNASTASVLPGNGDGTFGAPISLSSAGSPTGVAVGDFNEDGRADLVITDASPDSISVFLNTGTAGGAISFGASTTFVTGVDPLDVVVADFDGDGNLDVATSDAASNQIGVLRGNGDGTFVARVGFAAAGYTIGMTATDLDGDGKLDLAIALAAGDSVGVLRNTSTSGSVSFDALATFIVGDGPFDVTAGDFNEDGKIDLAVTNNGTSFAFPTTTGSTLSVLLNTSTGTGNVAFATATTFATGMGPAGIVAADFTQDGNLDLAVANGGGNTVSLLAGNGDGTFQAQETTAVSGVPRGLATGDLDGDGVPDLIVAQSSANTLTSLISDSELFTPPPPTPTPPTPPTPTPPTTPPPTGGMAVNAPDGSGIVRISKADGTIVAMTPYTGFTGRVVVATGQLTGDSTPDVVTGANGHVKVFDGATGTEVRSFFAFDDYRGGLQVAVGDVNDDGMAEIVVSANANGHVKVFDGQSVSELFSFFAYQGYSGPVVVAVGDLDGDGQQEVLTGVGTESGVHVKSFDGTSLEERDSFFVAGTISDRIGLAVGDLDGDDRDDFVISQGTRLSVFDGPTKQPRGEFAAFDDAFLGLTSVQVNEGRIVAIAEVAGRAHVKKFDGQTFDLVESFFPDAQ